MTKAISELSKVKATSPFTAGPTCMLCVIVRYVAHNASTMAQAPVTHGSWSRNLQICVSILRGMVVLTLAIFHFMYHHLLLNNVHNFILSTLEYCNSLLYGSKITYYILQASHKMSLFLS